ncbi:MAG TPA: hypothetical protein VGG19_05555 [Tepidisphaeraceae bacterium]
MSEIANANSSLYQFLDSVRVRLERINFLSAGGIAATLVCVVASPFVAWRAELQLRDSLLVVAVIATMVAGYAVMAMRRAVRIMQVPERLEVAIEERERIATAAEFMTEDDPFKRLAVRQTEQWIEYESERLAEVRRSGWPIAGIVAIVLLILLWILTPSWRAALPRIQILNAGESAINDGVNNSADDMSSNQAAQNRFNANGNARQGKGGGAGNGLGKTSGAGGTGAGANGGASGKKVGGIGAPGAATAVNPDPSQQNTLQPTHSNAPATPQAWVGSGARSSPPVPHKTPEFSGASRTVHAAIARPSHTDQLRNQLTETIDQPGQQHAAQTDAQLALPDVDPAELDALPPDKRQIVIEYFRAVHNQALQQNGETAP